MVKRVLFEKACMFATIRSYHTISACIIDERKQCAPNVLLKGRTNLRYNGIYTIYQAIAEISDAYVVEMHYKETYERASVGTRISPTIATS